VDAAGRARPYLLYPAPGASADRPAPLVVALHGFGETPAVMARVTRFHELGAREGFHVAYAQGRMRRWNAFDDLGYHDIAYLRALVADVEARRAVDPRRVYLTGVSNGGMMAHRAAVEAPDLFAAVAPVLAVMPATTADTRTPSRSVPILMVNGMGDRLVPPHLDHVRRFFLYSLPVYPLEETAAWWAEQNGCGAPGERVWLNDTDPGDGTRAWRRAYTGCGAPVTVVGIENGGHAWPGAAVEAPRWLVGRTSRDLDATRLVWDFFREHRLPAADPEGGSGLPASASGGTP
jgi:polyhydroxybutyrate depolymerase